MDKQFDSALERAKQLTHEGRLQEALVICNEITNSYPDNYQAFELRSSIYRKLNDLVSSVSDIDKVIALAPDSAAPHFRKGRYLTVMGHVTEAVKEFTKAIELDNGYFGSALYFHRAEALLRMGDYNGALGDCQHVAPDHTEKYFYGHSTRSRCDIQRDAANGLVVIRSQK